MCVFIDASPVWMCFWHLSEVTKCFISGVKEIDIAATLEHVRDQRPGMVRTKVLTSL